MVEVRPTFFIGAPRSGTTLIFSLFSRHKDVGYISNYQNLTPNLPISSTLNRFFDNRLYQYRGRNSFGMARWLRTPNPSEAYNFWDELSGINFSRDYLRRERASAIVKHRIHRVASKVLKYSGKDHLACKLTGPPRIAYLNSLFPDARFVQIVRDGRAVINSLLRVDFWPKRLEPRELFWNGGLTTEDELQLEVLNWHPAVLAALHWRRILEVTDEEMELIDSTRFWKLRYEDFVAAPETTIEKLLDFADLRIDGRTHLPPQACKKISNRNGSLSINCPDDIANAILAILERRLVEHGYHPQTSFIAPSATII